MLPRADPSYNRSCTFSKRVSSLVYFVRWYPPHIVSEVVHEVHEKIFQFFLKVTALEGKTLDSDHFSRLRIEVALPYRKAGVALRELHRIAPAAYLASWLDAATALCECRAAPLGSFVESWSRGTRPIVLLVQRSAQALPAPFAAMSATSVAGAYLRASLPKDDGGDGFNGSLQNFLPRKFEDTRFQ